MTARKFVLDLLPYELAIARLDPRAALPAWAEAGPWVSITRTSSELSVVCEASRVPLAVQSERGFRALRVRGPLAFSEIGVMSSLAAPLSGAGISIFALSTYDTDYLLVQDRDLPAAIASLSQAGHRVESVDAS